MERIDHINFVVADLDAMTAFYPRCPRDDGDQRDYDQRSMD